MTPCKGCPTKAACKKAGKCKARSGKAPTNRTSSAKKKVTPKPRNVRRPGMRNGY